MSLSQTEKNMVACCQETLKWCERNGVGQDTPGFTPRHRLQRIVIMTVMTESGGHMYANANIASSLKLPHDAVGNDHHSVGLFQQQVGSDGSNAFGWGTVAQCMDVDHSVDAFLQISAFPDGSNYRLNYMPAKFFIDRRDIRNAIRGRPLET
jgi:hypothetical protein